VCTRLTQIYLLEQYNVFYVQPEDGHYQARKNVVVHYVKKILYILPINIVVLDQYTHSTLVIS